MSYQHVSKNQNMLWCLIEDIVGLSIQAAKSKSSSCSRKKSLYELWPICQALLASKFGKRELVLDLQSMSCMKQELHQVFFLHTLFLRNKAQINKNNIIKYYGTMFLMSRQVCLSKVALDPAKK